MHEKMEASLRHLSQYEDLYCFIAERKMVDPRDLIIYLEQQMGLPSSMASEMTGKFLKSSNGLLIRIGNRYRINLQLLKEMQCYLEYGILMDTWLVLNMQKRNISPKRGKMEMDVKVVMLNPELIEKLLFSAMINV